MPSIARMHKLIRIYTECICHNAEFKLERQILEHWYCICKCISKGICNIVKIDLERHIYELNRAWRPGQGTFTNIVDQDQTAQIKTNSRWFWEVQLHWSSAITRNIHMLPTCWENSASVLSRSGLQLLDCSRFIKNLGTYCSTSRKHTYIILTPFNPIFI